MMSPKNSSANSYNPDDYVLTSWNPTALVWFGLIGLPGALVLLILMKLNG